MPAVDGLISGLNTRDIISQLMQLERQPQIKLQKTQATVERSISSLRGMNTSFAAIATAANKLITDKGWQLTSATSSDTTRVSVSATAGAAQAELSFNVAKLAQAATSRSEGAWADATSPVLAANTKIYLAKGSAAATEIDVGDGSLNSIAAAINKAGAGVQASVVKLADGNVKLNLQSTTTGANNLITVRDAPGSTTDPFAATALGAIGGTAATGFAGQDAELVVFGETVTRSSNTISDLLPGVTMTLTKADTQSSPGVFVEPPVTVKVKSDPEAMATQVASMVDAINSARAEIKSLTSYNIETRAKGPLYGASDIRGLRDRLSATVVGDGTTSAGVYGVSVSRDGNISFDRTKFLAALEKDPAGVQAALGANGLAGRIHELAEGASRSKTAEGGPGLIASAITSRESQVASLKTSIASWDNRLKLREQSLQRQYAGLETALGAAQQQGQWLAGQIAGLPSWGG